ncbi:unnamed protein product [Arctogadus glacialis]
MPTSPVKTRIPLTSFGHLITEVKRQLFGIEAPAAVDLIGWKKYFNSYTLQGRRNVRIRTQTRGGLDLELAVQSDSSGHMFLLCVGNLWCLVLFSIGLLDVLGKITC